MSIEIRRAYENASRLSIRRDEKEFIRSEIIVPRDGEAPSLSITWSTDKGIRTTLDEGRALLLALTNTYETPRSLGRPPRYTYLDLDKQGFVPGYVEIAAPWSDDGVIAYPLLEVFGRKPTSLASEHLYRRKTTIPWVHVTTPFFSIYTDGENQLGRRVCLRALESMPKAVTTLITNTIITHLASGEQNEIFAALEQSWSSLPVLQRK